MKIRDLVQQTGVSKETVHYYIREGILPKPRKRGKNTADYDDRFVERIRLVKDLQDTYFLPLALIKNILKKSPEGGSFLGLSSAPFRPVDRLLPHEIVGEEEFCRATGLGLKWLAKMEEWKIITPVVRDGRKAYSQDDTTIARLILEMDRIGLGPKDGFNPEALCHYRNMFREIVAMAHRYFFEATLDRLTPGEYYRKMLQGREIMSTFFYHLYRKLSTEEFHEIFKMIKSQGTAEEKKKISGDSSPGLDKETGKRHRSRGPIFSTALPGKRSR